MATRDSLIAEIHHLMTEMMAQRTAMHSDPWLDSDLSMAQLKALFLVCQRGSARVGSIAEALGRSPNATTSLLDHLESAGLVVRAPDPSDRRAVLVELSPQGVVVVDDLMNAGMRQFDEELAMLTDAELKALQAGAAALHRVLGERLAAQESSQQGPEAPASPARKRR